MPCWESRNIVIEFRVANPDILESAIKALIDAGKMAVAHGVVRQLAEKVIERGMVVWAGVTQEKAEALARELKQEYGRQTVKAAAKQYGWQVRKTASVNRLQMTRRAF